MEIEKKYLVPNLPDLEKAIDVKIIKQGYISTSPVIRIRQSNDKYILTCKGKGLMAREEFELLLDETEFTRLSTKTDHHMISKKRYLFPYGELTIELDVFDGPLSGLCMAEVEFESMASADQFTPPQWFGKELTMDHRFQNSQLCQLEDLSSLQLN